MPEHRSLGIPPLGGIATYEEAARPGLSVEQNVLLLRRYAFIERRLMEIATAHLCAVPEWEVKCALSLHCSLDAEHATVLRQRVAEMREPPLHLDVVPDERLAAWLAEALHALDTAELLVGLYRVVRPALVAAYRRHLAETNPLADYPTCRHLRSIITEQEEMIAWGEAALTVLLGEDGAARRADTWMAHLHAYLRAAGDVWGDAPDGQVALPAPRAATPFELDLQPRRDERFAEVYEHQNFVKGIMREPARSPRERTLALMYKRLREMDVPEMMAPLIAQTTGKPWEYYREMTRQLWDEARHAMMGEVAFVSLGIDWTALPLAIDFSYSLNKYLTPLERHAVLYSIEQGLMNRTTGKRAEWEVACSAGSPLFATFQDYDWADEVLHAQIGRRWFVPEAGDRDQAARFVAQVDEKIRQARANDPILEDTDTLASQLAAESVPHWWVSLCAAYQDREESNPIPHLA